MMNIATRKMNFIQEFLRICDEDLIRKLEKFLSAERRKRYYQLKRFMSVDKFMVLWLNCRGINDYYQHNASLHIAKNLAKYIVKESLILTKKPLLGQKEPLLADKVHEYKCYRQAKKHNSDYFRS